jgi:hypothetical protein
METDRVRRTIGYTRRLFKQGTNKMNQVNMENVVQKLFAEVAAELGQGLHPDIVGHFLAGEIDELAATAPNALQIAQEVCAVVSFLHTDICPLVGAHSPTPGK